MFPCSVTKSKGKYRCRMCHCRKNPCPSQGRSYLEIPMWRQSFQSVKLNNLEGWRGRGSNQKPSVWGTVDNPGTTLHIPANSHALGFRYLPNTSDVFRCLWKFRTSSEIFGYDDCVIFAKPDTPRIKSHAYNSEKVGRYTLQHIWQYFLKYSWLSASLHVLSNHASCCCFFF